METDDYNIQLEVTILRFKDIFNSKTMKKSQLSQW